MDRRLVWLIASILAVAAPLSSCKSSDEDGDKSAGSGGYIGRGGSGGGSSAGGSSDDSGGPTEDDGSGGKSSTGGSGGSSNNVNPVCGDCLRKNCQDEMANCAGHEYCTRVYTCAELGDNVDEKVKSCINKRDGGKIEARTLFIKLETCKVTKCAPECLNQTTGCRVGAPECATCYEQLCPEHCTACQGNTACMEYYYCQHYCTTTACANACDKTFADGKTAYAPLSECRSSFCSGECL